MKKYVPGMYRKSIFDIDYNRLKEKQIRCIIFDLDNTLLLPDKTLPQDETISLIKKLQKDFKICIISNNSSKKRVDKVAKILGVEYIKFAGKPFSFGFKKIQKRYRYSKKEMCIVGDQLMTDILGGNRFHIFTILVEPLGKKELKITSFNRLLEKRKMKKLENLGLFKKGEFYE